MIPLIEQKKAIQTAIGFTGRDVDGDFGPLTIERLYTKLVGKPVPTGNSTLAQRIVEIASGEVGIRESGGNNKGERIAVYQRATWLPVGPWPWCAAFVDWVIMQAISGLDTRFARPETAGAWDLENWARQQAGKGVTLIKPATAPQSGDIVIYTFSHVGLVESYAGDKLVTIEGNTGPDGGRDGDGVYRKTTRTRSQIRSLIRIE